MKFVSIDFEFNRPRNAHPTLVCASVKVSGEETRNFWLHNDPEGKKTLKEYILSLKGHYFLAFAAVAEARCFLALGLDPLMFKWIDEHIEYRHIGNHNHRIMYGHQYKDGKVIFTRPPKNKFDRDEEDEDEADSAKPSFSLASACFKLLGHKIDTAFKTRMRDLIISCPPEFTAEEREEIMQYCAEDVEHLEPMIHKIFAEYKHLMGKDYDAKRLLKEMLLRGEYAARTAIMEQHGYPINVEMARNFTGHVATILWQCQREIAKLFPHNPPFRRTVKSKQVYSLHEDAVREEIKKWLKANPRQRWMMTDGGKSGIKQLSLSLKAFERHFNFTHTYPKDHYFAQVIRYLKLKQNLNGFLPPKKGKTNFWDYVGEDGMVRPYMGIYTAQSSRSQPKATSFIPLKSAWMRCMIYPPEGYLMGSIDYSSVEFLIAALLSGDTAMLRDYKTGDVYLAFGKASGYIPQDGTKATHKAKRDDCKPIILGLQFDMSEYGLAKDLTEKWKRPVSPQEALQWITRHRVAYRYLWRKKADIQKDYRMKKFIRLRDGWTCWGDNPNFRSVGNVPVQGACAVIMRRAVQLAQDAGLRIAYTLHDALYIMFPENDRDWAMATLAECMDQAFREYFPGQEKLADVRMEGDVWGSPELNSAEKLVLTYKTTDGTRELPVSLQDVYIDERGEEEYEAFKKYFEAPDLTNLIF